MDKQVAEKTASILNALPFPLLIIDNDAQCDFANKSFKQLVGEEDVYVIGNSWLDAIGPIKQDIIIGLCGDEPLKLEFLCGSYAYSLKLNPASIGDGYYCCTVELLSQESRFWKERSEYFRTEPEKQQKLLQDVLDSTDALLYSVDLQGKITVFNRVADRTVRFRKGKGIAIGDSWFDIIDDSTGLERERMEMLLQHVIAGGSYKTIEDIRGKDGEKITYSVQASPVYDDANTIIGAMLCAHDITLLTQLQREAAEKALVRSRELEELNEFYDMILAVIAHDMRQPFSSISLIASMFLKNETNVASLNIKSIMASLSDTCSMSIDLFNGILEWVKSRKEGRSYLPGPINVKQLIVEANGLFLDNQKKKNIAFNIEIPDDFIIYAHHQMLLFIFRNIINNATQHSCSGGEIRIYSTNTPEADIISIKDNGKGIQPEKLKNLFKINKYSQKDETGGAGVALVISHSMMHQMGGRIWVDSEFGDGAAFHLAFPSCPTANR